VRSRSVKQRAELVELEPRPPRLRALESPLLAADGVRG
jgi:hypothetical protein